MEEILSILAALAPALFPILFPGKNKNQANQAGTSTGTTTSTTETPAKVAFDPMYYALAPAMMKMLGGQYTAMAGAGMPGGARAMGDVGLGNISDIMSLINASWPDIIGAMKKEQAPTTPAEDTLPEGSACGGVNEIKKCAAGLVCFNGTCRRAKNVS